MGGIVEDEEQGEFGEMCHGWCGIWTCFAFIYIEVFKHSRDLLEIVHRRIYRLSDVQLALKRCAITAV